MMHHAAEPAARHQANDAPPSFQQGTDASRQVCKASLIAGVALLLMSALAGFGYDFAIHGLITPGNAARTAQDIMAHQGLFRAGIASLFLVIALDVVAALGLYRVFSPVSKPVSAVAAGMRIVYAGIFAVAVVQLAGAARLLGGGTSRQGSGAARVHAQALSDINRFTDIWHAGLILFGLYLLVIAWLAWRSGYVPRLLSVLVAIAGLGYIYDSIGQFVSGGSWTQVSTVTFIGEFLLALWLVIRGRRITVSQPALRAEPAGAAR
jgi:Domain of unknown function (DUF4386)